MSFAGAYFDGNDLHGHPVEIYVQEDRSLLLRGENITIAVPAGGFLFSRPLARIPRFASLSEGRSVEIPWTAPGEKELSQFEQSPSWSRAIVRGLESRAAIVGLAVALLVATIATGLYVVLPHLARRIAFAVPTAIEVQIGNASEAALSRFVGQSTGSWYDQRRAERQLERLVRVRPMHVRPYLVFCAMGQPNAFALPGGPIIVTDELLRLDLSDDEIAAILAHELGHQELRHGLQNILSSSSALIVVSIITGDLSTLTHFSGTLPSLLLSRGYSRDFERQADAYGVVLLAKAGIDPAALANALKSIEKSSGSPDAMNVAYLSTHPSTPERIRRIRALAATVWTSPAKPVPTDEFEAPSQPPAELLLPPAKSAIDIFHAATTNPRPRAPGTDVVISAGSKTSPPPVKTLRFPPDDAPLFNKFGRIKSDHGDEKGAMADFERAIATDRNYAPAYNNRGYRKRRRGDLNGAIADFNRTLELDPRYILAYNNRGVAEALKGDLTAAIADFNRALAINPDDAMAYSNLGLASIDLRQFGEAIANFNRAIALSPNTVRSYDLRGFAEIRTNETGAAIADFDQATVRNPNYAMAYRNRGVAEEIRGDFPGAKADYLKYSQLAPKDADADGVRLRLALISRREQAGAGPEKFPAEPPVDSGAWMKTLGLFVNGRVEEAELLKKASEGETRTVGGQRCLAYYYLGMMHRLKGENNQALNSFNKCVQTEQANLDEFCLAEAEINRFQQTQVRAARRN